MSTASDTLEKKDGKRGGVSQFIRDTRAEWDKSTFPSSEDVRNTTIIVIISVVLFAIFLWLVDVGWVFVLDLLAKAVNAVIGV
ncbi:MAG: preprotein translocase subunit SecE [Pyrinomonadaceae bacterium]